MFEGKRLCSSNIKQYINTTDPLKLIVIEDISPLLQKNYQGENNCIITSITCIIKWYKKKIKTDIIYKTVEQIAKQYGYYPDEGVFPIAVPRIYKRTIKIYNLNKKIKTKHFKNFGFTFKDIQNSINNNHPVLMSVKKDGRNYYIDHSVLVIGYIDNLKQHILVVYDNWNSDFSYIDYDKLSLMSSVSFLYDK